MPAAQRRRDEDADVAKPASKKVRAETGLRGDDGEAVDIALADGASLSEDIIVGHSEDGLGLKVEFISLDECSFLYDEIFVRQEYLRHGLSLKPGAGDVLDVGANIGLFSLFCQRVLSQAGSDFGRDRIFAFEPVPRIFKVLRRNVGDCEGAAAAVIPQGYGLGAQESAAETFFYFEDSPGESTRRGAEGQRQRVIVNSGAKAGVPCTGEVRVLSEVMRRESIQRVQLLKIDVEGDELDVLLGLQATDWPKIDQVVVEVHDDNFRVSRVRSLLERHGFVVMTRPQRTAWHEGALVCIPASLRLFYVYARKCAQADS